MAYRKLNLTSFLFFILLLAAQACRAAAEPESYTGPFATPLLEIILRLMTNRCDITTPLPAHIPRLIYDYIERRKPVTPMAIEYSVPVSIPICWGHSHNTIRRAFLNCTKQHWLPITRPSATHDRYEICIDRRWRMIERILGVDYHKNSYSLGSHGLAKAFDPEHPGVWFEPGEVERFLSTPCDGSALFYQEELDLDGMNQQALALCEKQAKNKSKKAAL